MSFFLYTTSSNLFMNNDQSINLKIWKVMLLLSWIWWIFRLMFYWYKSAISLMWTFWWLAAEIRREKYFHISSSRGHSLVRKSSDTINLHIRGVVMWLLRPRQGLLVWFNNNKIWFVCFIRWMLCRSARTWLNDWT